MNQQIVSTSRYTHNFKQLNENDNLLSIPHNCMQINGQSENVTDFLNSADIDSYCDFKYRLMYVYNQSNSKNFTAFLYRN